MFLNSSVFFSIYFYSCRGALSVTFIQVKSQHSSTWLGGKTYGGCLPDASQMPPDVFQMTLRCLPDDFQMPTGCACLPDVSQMRPRCDDSLYQQQVMNIPTADWGHTLVSLVASVCFNCTVFIFCV